MNDNHNNSLSMTNNIPVTKKEQIISSELKLLAAMKNSDVKQLDELLHEELLFHIPNGQVITKAMDLDAHRSGVMHIYALLPSEQVIHVLEDTAVVSVKMELKGKYIDQPIDAAFRYIRVWKLVNDSWKVIAGSCIQL